MNLERIAAYDNIFLQYTGEHEFGIGAYDISHTYMADVDIARGMLYVYKRVWF